MLREMTMRSAASLAGVLLLALATASPAADAPYVARTAAGGWQALTKSGPVAVRGSIDVDAVGSVPAFRVMLRAPARIAPDEVLTKNAPMLVVADTHGEYEIFVAQLRKQGVVGAGLEWKFGRGHLVMLGDVFDRGPNQTEILWLLYRLEADARRAGGGVHVLLGNHEVMALTGDARYLNPKYAQTVAELGVASYSELFGPSSVLGQWLRTLPAVLKINDLLCLHAGVSRALLDAQMPLSEINARVRASLDAPAGPPPARDALISGKLGPLWYRGYFADQTDFPTATMDDIDATLARFGVHHILVGHTIVSAITPLYDGKVFAVQVYPHRDDSGVAVLESLRVERGKFWRARLDGPNAAL